jgi:hypothetical protein
VRAVLLLRVLLQSAKGVDLPVDLLAPVGDRWAVSGSLEYGLEGLPAETGGVEWLSDMVTTPKLLSL